MRFSIVHNLVNIDFTEMFDFAPCDITRGHKFKLRASKPRLNTRLHFFGYRIVSIWNDLPEWCADASSLTMFKAMLQSIDFSKHLRNEHDRLYFN